MSKDKPGDALRAVAESFQHAVEHINQVILHLEPLLSEESCPIESDADVKAFLNKPELAAITHAKEAYRYLTGVKWDDQRELQCTCHWAPRTQDAKEEE
jgi:hypothetical protein